MTHSSTVRFAHFWDSVQLSSPDPLISHRKCGSRLPKQGRSEEAIAKISKAVVSLLASEGPAAITHRRVAEVAGVSLAATTYYYSGKFEMIADAQARLLNEYVEAFVRAKDRHEAGRPVVNDLPELIVKLLKNAAGRHSRDTLAWSEIMLDCARDERGHALACQWFDRIERIWGELLAEFGTDNADNLVNPAIDTVIGLLFITVPLQLSPEQIDLLLDRGEPLSSVCADLLEQADATAAEEKRPTGKARETRDRIISAAVAELESLDSTLFSYRSVAQRAGLTNAAPAYHFATIDQLLTFAQAKLLGRMSDRYSGMLAYPATTGASPSRAADLLATVYIRSVVEDGASNLAVYAAWLNATRKGELRAHMVTILLAMEDEFAQFLAARQPELSPRTPIMLMAQFLGSSIRALATGVKTDYLARARSEFEGTIRAISLGRHPMLR